MMRILYQMPDIIQRLYRGVVWRLTPNEKTIYLTFDDGCIPGITPQVLDILDRYHVKATFFMVGDNIRKYPEIFQQVVERGHSVGNHTFNHLKGTNASDAEYFDNIHKTDDMIDRLHPLGTHRPHLLRPPYGKMSFSQKRELRKTHTIILWDIITHDYNAHYTPAEVMNVIRRYSRNGSVVVFHDSLKAAKNMLSVLPQAIEFWQQQGYELRPITD